VGRIGFSQRHILPHADIRHILGDEEATAAQVVPPVLGGALTPQIVPPFSSGEQVLRRMAIPWRIPLSSIHWMIMMEEQPR